MRKQFAAIVAACTLGILGAIIPAGVANADVIAQVGHRQFFYDIRGNITSGISDPATAYRVAVVIRQLGSGGVVNSADTNVCVQPYLTTIARTTVGTAWLNKDGNLLGLSNPNVTQGTDVTNCGDLDPNPSMVCGPSRSSVYTGAGSVGVRRTDGVLISTTLTSLTTTLPCD